MKNQIIGTIWRISLIIIGAAITASGISFFLMPHRLLTGGVSGTAILISYLSPISVGTGIVVLNIPLFIMAWKKIDLKFAIYSVVGIISLSFAISIFSEIPTPIEISDPLLAALYGGMLVGGGIGLAIRGRGSQGGTDIISIILRRKYSISVGSVNLYVNIIIVSILSLKFNVELGLLTLFSQFLSSKAIDRIVTGFNSAKSVTIVSDRSEEIAEYIMKRMYRGVTFLEGKGGFGGSHKKVILCIVTTSQLSRLKAAMRKIDPGAFMTVVDSSEIIGRGFYRNPLLRI